MQKITTTCVLRHVHTQQLCFLIKCYANNIMVVVVSHNKKEIFFLHLKFSYFVYNMSILNYSVQIKIINNLNTKKEKKYYSWVQSSNKIITTAPCKNVYNTQCELALAKRVKINYICNYITIKIETFLFIVGMLALAAITAASSLN